MNRRYYVAEVVGPCPGVAGPHFVAFEVTSSVEDEITAGVGQLRDGGEHTKEITLEPEAVLWLQRIPEGVERRWSGREEPCLLSEAEFASLRRAAAASGVSYDTEGDASLFLDGGPDGTVCTLSAFFSDVDEDFSATFTVPLPSPRGQPAHDPRGPG